MKFSIPGSGLGALLVLLAGTAPASSQTQVVHVRAWIDGYSELMLTGADVQWRHFDFAAPGRLNCDTGTPEEPTLVNGAAWYPTWPDVPTCENRFCGGCLSSAAALISPPLPPVDYLPRLVPLLYRGEVTLVEVPSAANGFRAVVGLDDRPIGGADWYEFTLEVLPCFGLEYCTSTPNSSGAAAYLQVAGDLSLSGTSTSLQALDCPASRPGIFFYGAGPANMPLANGRLCIDPFSGLHRMQAVWTDPTGFAELPLDFAALPFTPDDTWYFQYWFRDPAGGGTGSNLTDAVRVRFCP